MKVIAAGGVKPTVPAEEIARVKGLGFLRDKNTPDCFNGRVFTEKSDVLDVVERAICFFRDEGNAGERFADTIERLGFDYVEKKLLGE